MNSNINPVKLSNLFLFNLINKIYFYFYSILDKRILFDKIKEKDNIEKITKIQIVHYEHKTNRMSPVIFARMNKLRSKIDIVEKGGVSSKEANYKA